MVYNESTFGFIMNKFFTFKVPHYSTYFKITNPRSFGLTTIIRSVFIFAIRLHEIYFEYNRYLITFTHKQKLIMSQAILSLKNVTIHQEDKVILSNINLT
jgi:ABC-type molybdenum transport system ATPase subunit/photorepair protein PhrA